MIDAEARAQLQARLREALQERLAQPLHDLFDELDAHLFDLADRSRSSTQSQLYYDALRLLRSERVQVETSFLDNANLALGAGTVTGDGVRPAGPLRLVDIDELEETLTLEHQVQRISERLSRPLEALLARLAELSGTPAPERAQDSMISARGLSRMFRAALTPIGLNIEIRLIAFGLFGQHVLRSLASLYSRLNQILAEGGVLPELSESEPPSQRRVVHPSRRSARHRIPESGVKPAPPAAPPAPHSPAPFWTATTSGWARSIACFAPAKSPRPIPIRTPANQSPWSIHWRPARWMWRSIASGPSKAIRWCSRRIWSPPLAGFPGRKPHRCRASTRTRWIW